MMNSRRTFVVVFIVIANLATMPGCAGIRNYESIEPRPAMWAMAIDEPGLPNLHRVNESLYRGAQPASEGIARLEAMGVRTVINLRSGQADTQLIQSEQLVFESLPMSPWRPKKDDVVSFLRVATDSTKTPVFVHCEHGADRSGYLCAMYRIVVEDWSKEEAIREMTRGGYGFHIALGNLVDFVRDADIDEYRRAMVSVSD